MPNFGSRPRGSKPKRTGSARTKLDTSPVAIGNGSCVIMRDEMQTAMVKGLYYKSVCSETEVGRTQPRPYAFIPLAGASAMERGAKRSTSELPPALTATVAVSVLGLVARRRGRSRRRTRRTRNPERVFERRISRQRRSDRRRRRLSDRVDFWVLVLDAMIEITVGGGGGGGGRGKSRRGV